MSDERDLQAEYKQETGEEAMESISCNTNCQFDDAVSLRMFTSEYVWWLEGKLE